MITFAAPGFLLAGALLALVPLALHMLARTPPERRPLPTARFLTTDRRTRLRLRRPSDLTLLALRMLFLVLLGAAFARPEWVPDPSGGAVIVLLDAGDDMAPAWDEAVAAATDRMGDEGVLVVFDTAARLPRDPRAALDSLRTAGPATGPARYLAALRGLRATAGALHAESASAVLITRPRWGAWSPGVAAAREAAWPAGIEVVTVGAPAREEDEDVEERAVGRASAAVVGPQGHPLRPYVAAALQALGYAPGPAASAELVVVLPDGDDTTPLEVPHAPRVVLLGGPADAGDGRGEDPTGPAPWIDPGATSADARRSRGRLVLPGVHALEGWLPRDGERAPGAVAAAVWEDGRPAAAAMRRGEACVAYLAADPGTPAAAADPAFPRLLQTLAESCDAPASARAPATGSPDDLALAAVPLDRGALTVLHGPSLAPTADLTSLDGSRGRSLARLLAVLALLVALTETALAYGRREVP